MINGLGVLGWGVGGIEAEAVMLGQPYYMLVPEVVGVKLSGKLAEGATATDLVLAITEMLRGVGVVERSSSFMGRGWHRCRWRIVPLSATWHPNMEPLAVSSRSMIRHWTICAERDDPMRRLP